MDNTAENDVLIIGGPNVGKTHFGGQLYGRLNSRSCSYKIAPHNRPTDLTIFQDVLNKLYEGKRAGHTEASANRTIELRIMDEDEAEIVFAFPDYAGEQVKSIVETRKINAVWKQYVEKSWSWILFVRLDEIPPLEDIINRGIPDPEELQKRNSQSPPVRLSDAAHFVELLQMLLDLKSIPCLSKVAKPNLTIVLSCWDVLKLRNKTLPSDVLKVTLPLLYNFVMNTWAVGAVAIIGLSSTEKTLTDEADEDYVERTPIDFGYIINTNGEKEKDLTLSIRTFIGSI